MCCIIWVLRKLMLKAVRTSDRFVRNVQVFQGKCSMELQDSEFCTRILNFLFRFMISWENFKCYWVFSSHWYFLRWVVSSSDLRSPLTLSFTVIIRHLPRSIDFHSHCSVMSGIRSGKIGESPQIYSGPCLEDRLTCSTRTAWFSSSTTTSSNLRSTLTRPWSSFKAPNELS